jgi:hypothetical protein
MAGSRSSRLRRPRHTAGVVVMRRNDSNADREHNEEHVTAHGACTPNSERLRLAFAGSWTPTDRR